MSSYDIWIPSREWSRVRPVLDALNTPGKSLLRLPVHSWPATLRKENHRHGVFSGEARLNADELVGESINTQTFYDRGWTLGKFEQYVTSRKHLHLEIDGALCPTLAVLAGYLRAPIVVSDRSGERWTILLIDNWGDVTVAEYSGGPDNLEEVVNNFFKDGIKPALALQNLEVRTPRVDLEPLEERAALQQAQLGGWKAAHAGRTLVAPKDAELSPADLIISQPGDVDVHRPVLASARTADHLYEVILPVADEVSPGTVLCAVDGVLQGYTDPVTGVEKGLGAHAPEWAEWILNHSVPGRPLTAGRPWEGAGTEADLYRLSHDIVKYEIREAETSQFTTASGLGSWLKESLGVHNAPVGVYLLDDVPFVVTSTRLPLIEEHIFDRAAGPEVKVRYQADVFQPWTGVQNWFDPCHGGYSRNPSLQTTMDGPKLESFTAANCIDFAAVECDLLPGDTRAHENSWFVVCLEDTRTCIVFPAVGSTLQVSTDHDGASALITARERVTRVEELQRQHTYKTQWARWLDEDQQLSKEEIQAGLKTLALIIERSDDDPDGE